jgi:hypothetical protein
MATNPIGKLLKHSDAQIPLKNRSGLHVDEDTEPLFGRRYSPFWRDIGFLNLGVHLEHPQRHGAGQIEHGLGMFGEIKFCGWDGSDVGCPYKLQEQRRRIHSAADESEHGFCISGPGEATVVIWVALAAFGGPNPAARIDFLDDGKDQPIDLLRNDILW